MSRIRMALVFLASLTLGVAQLNSSVDAKRFANQNRKLIGEKTVDSTPVTKSKSLTFVQSGGFVSVLKKFEKQFSDMSQAEAAELEKLLRESGLATAKSAQHESGGADMFTYDFTYNDGKESHHVVYDDGTLPNSYRPLVKYLSTKLVDQRRK